LGSLPKILFFASFLLLNHFFTFSSFHRHCHGIIYDLNSIIRPMTKDERRVTLSLFSPSCPPFPYIAILATLLFFFRWSTGMATDIDSLAPGLDGLD
jgi:hypothetical protein